MKTKKMIATLVVALLSVTAVAAKRLSYRCFQSGTDGVRQLRTKGEEQYQVRKRT